MFSTSKISVFFLSMSITFKNAISNASFMVFSSQERCTRITVKGNTLLNRKGFKIYKIIHAGICSENQDIKNRLCLNKINYFVQFYGNAGLQWNRIWILTGSNLMAVSGEKFRKITYFANYCFFFIKAIIEFGKWNMFKQIRDCYLVFISLETASSCWMQFLRFFNHIDLNWMIFDLKLQSRIAIVSSHMIALKLGNYNSYKHNRCTLCPCYDSSYDFQIFRQLCILLNIFIFIPHT